MPRRSLERWLLALGFALLVLSQMRWGIGALAWVAPAPLLGALRMRTDRRFRAAFVGLFVVAWSLATLKIVTSPLTPVLALAYGVPVALVHLPAYFLWDRLVRRGRDALAVLAFAATTAVMEWAQAELSPMGVWGATPTTQIGAHAVMQLLAVVGMPGLSFLMNAVAAALEAFAVGRIARGSAIAITGATAAIVVWGAFRSVAPIDGPEVRAALVRTDATVSGLPIPSAERRRRDDETLHRRTAEAAAAGARIVVWPEGANLVLPEEERAYAAAASDAARRHGIELVVSYIVPVSMDPLLYENRARWFAPDGSERISYLKHRPVPGEPAVAGEAPAPTVDTTFGPATMAICYDYDFPSLGRVHARSGAGVVVVPSSDWRGIDPIHTEMAAMRAVEGGFSILRSTRFGLSAGIDAHGRLRAQQSTNETREPFLMASVPTTRVDTPYAKLGNLVLAPLFAILAWAALTLVRARGRPILRYARCGETRDGRREQRHDHRGLEHGPLREVQALPASPGRRPRGA